MSRAAGLVGLVPALAGCEVRREPPPRDAVGTRAGGGAGVQARLALPGRRALELHAHVGGGASWVRAAAAGTDSGERGAPARPAAGVERADSAPRYGIFQLPDTVRRRHARRNFFADSTPDAPRRP